MIKFYGSKDLLYPSRLQDHVRSDVSERLKKIPSEVWLEMAAVAQVFPFRVNQYVVEELIDWDNFLDDPIFRLTFPQGEMLSNENLAVMMQLLQQKADKETINDTANSIRVQLNPHPAGQVNHNVPILEGKPVAGIQHKYPETVLLFPTAGQVCHSFCTYCFRWPQFVGMDDIHRFSTRESGRFQEYIHRHKEVTDVLITGGDPMIMHARHLSAYIDPLLKDPRFDHVRTIRIGTKSVSYWPHRYVFDDDADDILRLFEKVVLSGKHLAIMCHYVHWRELENNIARRAIERIRSTGAAIYTQGPLMRRINDSSEVWVRMWKQQLSLGCIPYYFFMERDTGAKHYFEVPIVQAVDIFRNAIKQVSGLIKTVRGPVMSTLPGKVLVGISEETSPREKKFVLQFVQGRNPDWCNRYFFAQYDEKATWLSDLRPLGTDSFFYENELARILDQ